MCCCNTYEDVFGWIGVIIINIAFITIISFSATTSSFLWGFIICTIYTVLLFIIARYFDKPPTSSVQEQDQQEGERNDEGETIVAVNPTPTKKIFVAFFYGLGVLSLGASGFLFTLTIFRRDDPCTDIEGNYDDGYYSQCISNYFLKVGITNIFVSALPIIVVSIILWAKKSISTCGSTAYIGVAALGLAIFIIIDPEGNSESGFLKWWFFATSTAWILILSYLLIETDDKRSKAPLSWGVNTGSIAFFIVMFYVVDLPNDAIENWIMINAFSFIPLIFVGLLSDQNFVVFLGAIGFAIDAWRLSSDLNLILQFIVLGFTGIAIIFLGLWLRRNQDRIRRPFVEWIKKHPLLVWKEDEGTTNDDQNFADIETSTPENENGNGTSANEGA